MMSEDHRAATNGSEPLLCIAVGLRRSGWAVTDSRTVVASGVVGPLSRRYPASACIALQTSVFASLAINWKVAAAVRTGACLPWRSKAREELDAAMGRWAQGLGIPLSEHDTKAVRASVAGRHNASRGELCYAVMRRLRLIGDTRAAIEWEAIALGIHHLFPQC